MTYDVTSHLHKLHRFVVKPSSGGATCHPLLSPPRHCFAVMLSPRGATVQGQRSVAVISLRGCKIESRHVTYDASDATDQGQRSVAVISPRGCKIESRHVTYDVTPPRLYIT